MSQYRVGNVQVTNGSATVIGDTSVWVGNVNPGDLFTIIGSGVPYVIASVTDNTHLVLNVLYPGASMTGQAYTISTSFTPNIGLPYIQKGDVETATILKAQALQLDTLINFDTDLTSVTTGQALVYNGTDWVNAYVTELGTITTGVWHGTAIATGYGGTGLTAAATNGQLLIGNGSGYTLANITGGTGLSVTNGSGTIALANTGVTSNVAGTGITVSGATGAVTISNAGVTSASAGTGISVSGSTGVVTIGNTGVTAITGTTNQVTASASTGSVTLSLPQSIATTSTPTFVEVTITGTPTNSTDAATKAYVDSTANGMVIKASVQAATTANVTISNPATAVFDGVTLTSGQRLLVKNQSTASQNGIYVFNGSSSALTRSTDFSTGTTFSGSTAFVEAGTVNNATTWVVTTDDPITLGTTSISWTQFGGPGTYVAGTGLSLTGTTFANTGVTSIAGTANQITASASSGAVTLSLSSSYVGQTSITTLGTITTGTWNGTAINLSSYASGLLSGTYGGTGVNNGAATLTLGGSVTYSGAFTTTIAVTANTSVTLPTSGTLVNSAVATLSSLTSVGTIGTGVWQGTKIATGYGGTGLSSYTTGNLLYASASNTLSALPIGTTSQILTVVSGNPAWATPSGAATLANPTNTVGLTAKNGSLTSVMRSDAAPALDQSIAPTWTGAHTFNAGATVTTSSGTALTVNNVPGADAIYTNDGTCQVFLYTNGSSGAAFGTFSNQQLSLYTDNNPRIVLSAAGNATINAPSSETALTVTGYAAVNVPTVQVFGSTTAGSSNGIFIQAGEGNAGDRSLDVLNYSGTLRLFGVFGDGHFALGSNGSTNTITGSAAGVVSMPAYGAGTLSTNGSGVISASDGRYKTKTRALASGLSLILSLTPTYYRWHDTSPFAHEHEELGFIAQEVAAVIPEASPEPEEEGKFKNYHDRAIIAALVKAVQELQAEIAALKAAKG